MKGDGGTFTDQEVHYYLRCAGKKNPDGEWYGYRISIKTAWEVSTMIWIKNKIK
jgi:hypothetical protein